MHIDPHFQKAFRIAHSTARTSHASGAASTRLGRENPGPVPGARLSVAGGRVATTTAAGSAVCPVYAAEGQHKCISMEKFAGVEDPSIPYGDREKRKVRFGQEAELERNKSGSSTRHTDLSQRAFRGARTLDLRRRCACPASETLPPQHAYQA